MRVIAKTNTLEAFHYEGTRDSAYQLMKTWFPKTSCFFDETNGNLSFTIKDDKNKNRTMLIWPDQVIIDDNGYLEVITSTYFMQKYIIVGGNYGN